MVSCEVDRLQNIKLAIIEKVQRLQAFNAELKIE